MSCGNRDKKNYMNEEYKIKKKVTSQTVVIFVEANLCNSQRKEKKPLLCLVYLQIVLLCDKL